ncbi:unnamed protein product [Diatraea saccharalis]|uniref:Uncharacterized protein n=1 Tax=Diatraea saccharalis TaxID=40085 RepID=A0A9N9QTL2_9NEOP|nr:unnamed protein product [Diatraea saccharalis]
MPSKTILSSHRFIETKRKEEEQAVEKNKEFERVLAANKNKRLSPGSFISYNGPSLNDNSSTHYANAGPVVKLPVETKIVMRMDACSKCARPPTKKPEKVIMDKIDALDKETTELRTRAQKLARREAQRVELLERAEMAWKDLEMGYQRRLAAAEEKEEDMTKHIQKLIQERNGYKNACTTLAKQLKEKGDIAEKDRVLLTTFEKDVCKNACDRLRLSEEAAQLDAELAELQCKSTQLDRDLQFKEEQVRGRLQNLENEVDCARALTYEAERTIHAELSALRDQITAVSAQLLQEDEDNTLIKEELEQLRSEKMGLVEDLEGCQALCNQGTQNKIDELNKKREQLRELQEKVMECQCKVPVDAAIEVKRTPSLVALCKCMPEDKFSESCSCSSLRTTLLTNLLSDLFSGLQSELGGSCAQMPCQLLKCLEDKHNWDKSSVIKTNLQNYFSKLLVGELDIAIATSIEKYHARWVGASCADAVRQITKCCGADTDSNPDRIIEKRAQKLAARLAEKLFQERADQLAAKAKEVLKTGPPPCECSGRSGYLFVIAAVYPCFVKQPIIGGAQSNTSGVATPAYWRRTHQNVTQLRTQIEDLKKIPDTTNDDKCIIDAQKINNKQQQQHISRRPHTEQTNKRSPGTKLNSIKKKQTDSNYQKKTTKNITLGLQMDKQPRPVKKLEQSYAVHFCVCGTQKETNKTPKPGHKDINSLKEQRSIKPLIDDRFPEMTDIKQMKKIIRPLQSENIKYCRSDVACFHKPPSNTSIDNLLSTLVRWKCDLFKLSSKTNKNKVIDNSLEENKRVEDITKTVVDEKSIKDTSILMPQNVSVKTLVSQADPNSTKKVVANISKATDAQKDLPATTNSVYMGAINLEKSDENFCKCVIDVKNTSEFPYNCIDSQLCDCMNIIHQHKIISENNKVASETQQKNSHFNSRNSSNQLTSSNIKGNVSNADSKHISKASLLFPEDSQYRITFLGATLTNNCTKKDIVAKENTCYNVHHTIIKKHDAKSIKIPDNAWCNKHIKASGNCNGDEITFSNTLNSPETKINSCDCNVKCEEFKNFVNDVLSKHHEEIKKHENKALDTHSLKNSKLENCICCNIKGDESKELEVNTFHLLEEHLKNKLDEFNRTTCKSSCISSVEQEKLFSTILQRVRQLISDSTLSITCKCINEGPSQGSWHRAYMLLQEYLKIKINKVQCMCQLPQDNEQIFLPDVLEKVCNLIDSDFKRLKDLCKCKSERHESVKNAEVGAQDTIPEKDPNNTNLILFNEKKTSCKSMIPSQPAASQVSSNFGITTRSCSTNNKNVAENFTSPCSDLDFKIYSTSFSNPTTHADFKIKGILNNKYKNYTKENALQDHVNLHTKISTEKPIGNKNLDYDVNFCATQSPYIGYTVDCSCNKTLGTCSCSKSVVLKNTENIKNIWTKLTSKKINHKDHSYIMNAIPIKTEEIDESTERNETDLKIPTEKSLCDAKINVHYSEDITLKISNGKLTKIYVPSTTTTTSDDYVSLLAEEPIDWRDCNSTNTNSHKVINPSDNKWTNSLYYPIHTSKSHKKNKTNEKFDQVNLSSSLSSNCDCNMVPLCHVKMLVENIEKKIINSKCTCDSLCSKICPEHSKRNI